MKKLLLLALVAFIGINAQAQGKPEVITEQPAGTETVYKRVSGKMFFVKDKEIKMADLGKLIQGGGKPGDLKVVTADDGKTVYLKYVLTYPSFIKDDQAGGWVKGTKEGNKITIPAGQYIMYGKYNDGEYGIRVGYMEYKNNKFEVSDEPITFTLEGITAKLDGSYMEGSQDNIKLKILGGYWSDNNGFFCGDVETLCSTDPAGIENIEKADNKQIVGETYFDLSGRKLSESGKGLVIKSIKFADGTTKTVKYINK
ncbi:hypothetical protein [Alloprevotella tannerae]|jgi:hypothetical protein|uniref:hypothetical protein n=1 Tax=Alloprevotella tannerae TaxID=76122 RepID=UPI00241C9384|nr:hypothetical protein [Alloprevotella tannerae]